MVLTKEEKIAKKEAIRLQKLKESYAAYKKTKTVELQRELSAHFKLKKQLDDAWRNIMLQIKEPKYKEETSILWHIFERAYDRKDHVIKYTMKLLDVADDQFQRTVASFCDTVDAMIAKFFKDFDTLSKENDIRTAKLMKEGLDETAHTMNSHNVAETHLQLLLYHGYITADDLAWATRGENFVKQDEFRTKYILERDSLQSLLEDKYNLIWDEYKTVLKNYIAGVADNQKKNRKLRLKEMFMSDIIAFQAKRLANSNKMLMKLRIELGAYESGTKQAIFRGRRDRHRAACQKLKKGIIDNCAFDLEQINLLVKASDGAINWLECARKKVEKIHKMAALCREFESQREKILPFGCSIPHIDSIVRKSTPHHGQEEILVSDAISTSYGLARLWQRISKAELTKRALCREKLILQQQNSYIMRKIQEFRENNYGPGSQKFICLSEQGVNPPNSMKGVFKVNKYKKV